MALLVESEKTLKIKLDEMERKLREKEKQLQDKQKEIEGRIIPFTAKSSEKTIFQAMSQVSLKYLELEGLNNKNKSLENLAVKSEQERKTLEAKFHAWEAK